jgi:hypothetical protein
MELVNLLTQQLGINTQQASGGLGLLMGEARKKLGNDFGPVASAVPGVENLIAQAPKPGAGATAGAGLGGALGAIGGLLGGKAGSGLSSLGSLASLAGGFKQLGLSPDMIGKFVPIVLGFVQNKGGDGAKGLLERALK